MRRVKISFGIVLALLFGCVADDDFNIPEIHFEEPDIQVNTDLSTIKRMYRGFEPVRIETGSGSNEEMYISAYVISSDESGNIFKQLFIQDLPENPNEGVVISTHTSDLYTRFSPGRKIFFRVDGLYIGEFAGLPTIGIREGNQVGRLNIEDFEARIFRSQESVTLVPRVLSINRAQDPSFLATLVKLENVQFPEEIAGVEYYGNLHNNFGVNRPVENCSGDIITLRNNGYSDFKNVRLPDGNGSLTAIVSIYNNDYQLLIRSTEDVQMNNERCIVDTGIPPGALPLPFTEDFQDHPAGVGEVVELEGWTNINAGGGERLWEVREFSNNHYAQTSAFNSDEDPFEVWLITPGVYIPSGSSAILSFETKDGYYNGDALSVLISSDFDGDLGAATWTEVTANISQGNTGGYGQDFVPSGEIALSTFGGDVIYVGFRYLGSSNGITTTYQLDNISITE